MVRQKASMVNLVGLMLVMALLSAMAASAQLTIYPAKFICGFEQGDVTLLSDPDPPLDQYEDVKPGNYATTINILNLNLSSQLVERAVVVDGNPGPATALAGVNLLPFQAVETNCPEIRNALPSPQPVGVFKGYVILTTLNDDFESHSIYTFESQNATESPFGEPGEYTGRGLGASIDVERNLPRALAIAASELKKTLGLSLSPPPADGE